MTREESQRYDQAVREEAAVLGEIDAGPGGREGVTREQSARYHAARREQTAVLFEATGRGRAARVVPAVELQGPSMEQLRAEFERDVQALKARRAAELQGHIDNMAAEMRRAQGEATGWVIVER
ncbi:MAG: hypothetical protein Q8R92_10030 [Deltaproteobacteria bacterium]|nr:hypothetical protein [Deltaproteobacteria bacterium]